MRFKVTVGIGIFLIAVFVFLSNPTWVQWAFGPTEEEWLSDARKLIYSEEWRKEKRAEVTKMISDNPKNWFGSNAGIAEDGTIVYGVSLSSHQNSFLGDVNLFLIGDDEFVTHYHLCSGLGVFGRARRPSSATELREMAELGYLQWCVREIDAGRDPRRISDSEAFMK